MFLIDFDLSSYFLKNKWSPQSIANNTCFGFCDNIRFFALAQRELNTTNYNSWENCWVNNYRSSFKHKFFFQIWKLLWNGLTNDVYALVRQNNLHWPFFKYLREIWDTMCCTLTLKDILFWKYGSFYSSQDLEHDFVKYFSAFENTIMNACLYTQILWNSFKLLRVPCSCSEFLRVLDS